MTEGKNYRVIKEYGVIQSRTNSRNGDVTETKLTKTSWFGKPAKWDLRQWINGEAKSGIVIGGDESLLRLKELLDKVCTEDIETDIDDDD